MINTKKLCALLKKSRTVIWNTDNGVHFLSDRCFMIRFTELPTDVHATLLGIFLREPEMNGTLSFVHGEIKTAKVDFSKVYQPEGAAFDGKVTSYLKDSGNVMMRVLDISGEFRLINETYASLTDAEHVMATEYPNHPIYMENNDLMVLPFRLSGDQQELIKIITQTTFVVGDGA